MPEQHISKARQRAGSLHSITTRIEADPAHHLTGPFMAQTPFDSSTPESTDSPSAINANGFDYSARANLVKGRSDARWLRWAVEPAAALRLLIIPVVLYVNWELLAPWVAPGLSNPFAPFLFISYPIAGSSGDDPRYAKGYLDLVFIAYHIVFFSFIRQFITITMCRPVAKYFGIKKKGKIDRFGEQGYALVYFTVFGVWGWRIMSQLPTWWYRTEYFWIDYPHWQMKPELKRYYIMQISYWCQQLIVLLLGLEKPRKDHVELVAHHIVTLWLVGWSYLMNFTIIGNAVYMSMDIPDAFLAFSKLLNYMQWNRAKVVSFGIFVVVWTYFRHWLNFVILWSVWKESRLAPLHAKQWLPAEGVWFPEWVRHQMLLAIGALQALNLFWYYLVMRVLVRTVMTSTTEDERSDDEDDGAEAGIDEKHD